MAGAEAASIELRSLREALHEGDRLAWAAFRHAAWAADGIGGHPSLDHCAGCDAGWTVELGPQALVEADIAGERAVGLLCEGCAGQAPDQVGALLRRILLSMLPRDVRVVESRVVQVQPAGHA